MLFDALGRVRYMRAERDGDTYLFDVDVVALEPYVVTGRDPRGMHDRQAIFQCTLGSRRSWFSLTRRDTYFILCTTRLEGNEVGDSVCEVVKRLGTELDGLLEQGGLRERTVSGDVTEARGCKHTLSSIPVAHITMPRSGRGQLSTKLASTSESKPESALGRSRRAGLRGMACAGRRRTLGTWIGERAGRRGDGGTHLVGLV